MSAKPRPNPERLTDEEFEAVVQDLQRKLAQVEELPESFRDRVFDLLNDLDRMHREALGRMLELIDLEAPRIFERLAKDAAVQTLLLLYELSSDAVAGAEKEAQAPLIDLEGGKDA